MNADDARDALDVAMRHTLRFVERVLPERVVRLLEFGCGDGRLAERLKECVGGLVAIDVDPACVAEAREHGIDARVADWVEFDDGDFDAILFTRSLHHIDPLDVAVKRAAQHFAPGGDLIVEDFAFAEIAPTAVGWLCGTGQALRNEGVIDPGRSSFVAKLLEADDPLGVWRRHHSADGHTIHNADAMAATIRTYFASVQESSTPYLYRYLCTALIGPRAAEIAAGLLNSEMQWTQRGGIRAIGRRWVASGPTAVRV